MRILRQAGAIFGCLKTQDQQHQAARDSAVAKMTGQINLVTKRSPEAMRSPSNALCFACPTGACPASAYAR